MNNEIKEIKNRLQLLHAECNPKAREEDINYTLDYITNLQQENERLKEENNNKAMNDYVHAIDESWYRELYDDYKSRCEKAIEYIKYNDDSLYTYEPDYDYEENLVDNYEPSNFREDLLNILQNGSDS